MNFIGRYNLRDFYYNSSILITGGTGSLGKALIKHLKKWNCKIIVYSRDEGKQALSFGNDPSIIRVIGDVRDFKKLDVTMKRHKPDYVIHTGALKRIDDMEFYPDECVKTNILGSENVAIASQNNYVKKCILISTDKACQPINVYGSSKFIAERIFTNCDYNSTSTIFVSVRYGNVIASRGSFIPIWMDLISQDKKIQVTSMDCTRFLFTLGNAVDTVLNSLYYAQGGEVFIPKISSFKMKNVIESIKRISKLDSIEYDVIGMRPGEKFHEDMLCKTELEFTMQPSDKLLCVLPQYTHKKHKYDKKYDGLEFNSSLHNNDNIDDLVNLIKDGLNDA
jgi:FlaA1/EpsC-like NDP-sugar epimerase